MRSSARLPHKKAQPKLSLPLEVLGTVQFHRQPNNLGNESTIITGELIKIGV